MLMFKFLQKHPGGKLRFNRRERETSSAYITAGIGIGWIFVAIRLSRGRKKKKQQTTEQM